MAYPTTDDKTYRLQIQHLRKFFVPFMTIAVLFTLVAAAVGVRAWVALQSVNFL